MFCTQVWISGHTVSGKHSYTYTCKNTYNFTDIDVHMYMCLFYVSININMKINSCIHTYIHTYIRTYIHTYIRTYVRTYVRTYIHTYIHACVYVDTNIYRLVYIYKHRVAIISRKAGWQVPLPSGPLLPGSGAVPCPSRRRSF